jgi:hypothetical protein
LIVSLILFGFELFYNFSSSFFLHGGWFMYAPNSRRLFYNFSSSFFLLSAVGLSVAAVVTRKWQYVAISGLLTLVTFVVGIYLAHQVGAGIAYYLYPDEYPLVLITLRAIAGPIALLVGLLKPAELSRLPSPKPTPPVGQTLTSPVGAAERVSDGSTYSSPGQPTFAVQIFGGEGKQFSIVELQQMATTGLIKPTTLVQQVGSTFTVQASTIPGVFSDKTFVTALLLSLFLGSLGIDRFYLGYAGLGILKLLSLGGCGIWALIDFILIAVRKVKDADGRPLA